MEHKSNAVLWIGVLIAIVIAIGAALSSMRGASSPTAGAVTACNGGNCTNYSAVDSTAGYWINGTQVFSSAFLTAGTFTQGGGITASSTSASVTLAGTEFTTSNVLDYTVNVGSPSLTLSASTTAICPSTAGQVRTLYIRNATTTATSNLTIVGGTGVLLKKSATSTGTTIYGDTDGANYARLDVTRKANTDCEALFTSFTD